MADANKEPRDDGLDTLPEAARKETEEIIKEIEKENALPPEPPKDEKPEDSAEKPPQEDKPAEKPKADQGQPKADDKPEEARKKVKLMPVWAHKAAEDQWNREKTDLETKLADAAKASARDQDKQGSDKKDQDQIDSDLRKKTDAFALKYGSDPEEEFEKAKAYRDAISPPQPKVVIPKDIEESLKDVKNWKEQQEVAAEENLFNLDFDKKILPLVHAEYGKDVPESVVDDVKNKVKAKAYSDEYAKVPLTTIYKGEDEFRALIPAKQRGSEESRGGHQADHERSEKPDGPDLSGKTELTSAQLAALSGDDFDKYSNNRAAAEKAR